MGVRENVYEREDTAELLLLLTCYLFFFYRDYSREWPKAHWDVTRHINFGRQISDGRVSTKTLTIRNDGSKAGTFSIQCGLEALAFEPSSDTVAPFSSVDVKVSENGEVFKLLIATPHIIVNRHIHVLVTFLDFLALH